MTTIRIDPEFAALMPPLSVEERAQLEATAHHEAAHAVVNYRAAGFVGGEVTIIPNPDRGTLGTCDDGYSDSFNADHVLAHLLSLYAGAHAERRSGAPHALAASGQLSPGHLDPL